MSGVYVQYGDTIDVADWFAAFCHVYGRPLALPGGAETEVPQVLRKASKRGPRGSRKILQVCFNELNGVP